MACGHLQGGGVQAVQPHVDGCGNRGAVNNHDFLVDAIN